MGKSVKNIHVDADTYARLQELAEAGESPADVLRRRVAGHVIQIDDDTYSALLGLADSFGETASDVIRRVLGVEGPPEPNPDANRPSTVEFHISHGTGSGPWNAAETAVHALVGDTLRIVNDDDVGHRLHTDAAGPFPHPETAIAPGASMDFALTTAFTGRLYDHDFGPAAAFWLTVTTRP